MERTPRSISTKHPYLKSKCRLIKYEGIAFALLYLQSSLLFHSTISCMYLQCNRFPDKMLLKCPYRDFWPGGKPGFSPKFPFIAHYSSLLITSKCTNTYSCENGLLFKRNYSRVYHVPLMQTSTFKPSASVLRNHNSFSHRS